jgi:divalent metal cation (Fe/Co/Zn/Cd) transporter
MGGNIVLDGHVLLSEPTVSVSEGHRIGEAVRKRLKKRFRDLTDITIHVDAEDDRFDLTSARLPLRADLLERLAGYWKDIPAAASVEKTVIHYLEGRIRVEIRLALDRFEDIQQAQNAARQLTEAAASDPDIERINILFS